MTYPQLLTPEEKLANAKERLNIPRIVAICGSTRFMNLMAEVDLLETANGHIVVKPGCNMKQPHPLWTNPADAEVLKVRLDELHRAKIRLADEILVVGDYIGDSTRAEIAYARSLGKPVRFTHPEVDPGEPDGDPAATQPTATPTATPDVAGAIVTALTERAGELSALAEEEMRPSLEERAQEWHEAADVARRTAAKARQNGAQ